MWLPTLSVESLTRPRLAVTLVSTFAAASIGYYAYQIHTSSPTAASPTDSGGGLHRSNAVRRSRRHQEEGPGSSASSEAAVDENAENNSAPRAPGDVETVIESEMDEWWNDPSLSTNLRAGHNIVNLLFRVSEDNAKRNGCVHRGCQCNACGMVPIRGVRYRCANCADFDLCETCEAQGIHTKTHIFYKIRVPAPPFGPRQMQPVWYTGDPDTCRRSLPKLLIPKLSRETGFERPELEAFWEQWTFMANTEWRDDPDELGIAMDRKTFERCLVPTGGSRNAAPNLIHDRMFSFYDYNRDELIGFTEFLHGLSYRKRKDKLRKVFEGYDIDGDGFVDRSDFLRMFRAYYVLYKQMHKDILDGLEDQLLASTEAHQLVSSRQPLSSLFGREGRVPAGEGHLRHEGKTFHPDGRTDVDEGYENVVAEDRGDTATRQDILTSLFAVNSDRRPHRGGFITRSDTDMNWRTVRRMSGGDPDRTYWVTLLEPPANLEDLPAMLMGNATLEIEEPSDDDGDDEDRPQDHDSTSAAHQEGGEYETRRPTDSEARAQIASDARQQVPKLEKRKRDMARRQLHDRWKRRQFYLDEEEGGIAPDDWEQEEDVLNHKHENGESSTTAGQEPPSPLSGSSSKVRFAEEEEEEEEEDDDDSHSMTSVSSRSTSEGLPDMIIPDSERDAGREILYQVTQQAFNELLDTIFKPFEDIAIQAAETRAQRQKYKHLLDAMELDMEKKEGDGHINGKPSDTRIKAHKDKTLADLLEESRYTVEEGRNAVEIDTTAEIIDDEVVKEKTDREETTGDEERCDPTLPQFRPDVPSGSDDANLVWYPLTNSNAADLEDEAEAAEEVEPTPETLKSWKRLEHTESIAKTRGGWGKLSFEEFEEIYKSQEHQGNRLDYLGSWIDFCIP